MLCTHAFTLTDQFVLSLPSLVAFNQQYKKVKISAEQWLANTKEVWKPNEIIYLATDERNKTFFNPIADAGYTIRFLDDYWELAGLGDLDPNYFGMIDTIISSRGRAFAGTWFSTFTG